MVSENQVPQMFVRYIGTKVCWTTPDGRFYMGDRNELNDAERKVCDAGGDYLPLSNAVNAVAE